MAGFSFAADTNLVRQNIWSQQLKDILLPDLFAMKYVRMLTDFPDGNTINIPSIGQAETNDYVEGQAVKYNAMDTLPFTSHQLAA